MHLGMGNAFEHVNSNLIVLNCVGKLITSNCK